MVRALIPVLFSSIALGCGGAKTTASSTELPAFPDSPEGVFHRVRDAVERRDRAALVGCFASDGPIGARLAALPESESDAVLTQLAGALRGPQTLTLQGDWTTTPEGEKLRGRVDAPVAKGGGVGGLTFLRTAAGWRIWAW